VITTLSLAIATEPLMNQFEALIAAAQEHGDAEGAEAQSGDLEVLVAVAFGLLTEDQRSRSSADPRIVDLREVLGREEERRR
jgi:hypothetical protein